MYIFIFFANTRIWTLSPKKSTGGITDYDNSEMFCNQNDVYNENELCSRGDIEITGANARNADELPAGASPTENLPALP